MHQTNQMFAELDWIGIFRKVLDQVEEERRRGIDIEREEAKSAAEDEKETNPSTKLLTTEQLSELLQVPKSWVYDRTRNNRIPHYKLGGYVRFKLTEIQEWLVEHRIN